MGLVINTNNASITAQRHLETSRAEMESAMERLSSGKRINTAGDDAAGLSISHEMETQVASMRQATRNASDGIAMINMVEGAMDQFSKMLTRMKELAVQSMNGIYSDNDRTNMDMEFQALKTEMNRIAEVTVYNGVYVMKVPENFIDYQLGENSTDNITIEYKDIRTTNIGAQSSVASEAVAQVSTITTSGAETSLSLTVEGTTYTESTLAALETAINADTATHGVTAAVSGFDLTLTGKADGTAFSAGSSMTVTQNIASAAATTTTANVTEILAGAQVAQITTFTETNATSGDSYVLNVDGVDYAESTLTALAAALAAAGYTGSTVNGATDELTVTAAAGTAFTVGELKITDTNGLVENVTGVETQAVVTQRAAVAQVTTIIPTSATGDSFVLDVNGTAFREDSLLALKNTIDGLAAVSATLGANNELVITAASAGTAFTTSDLVITNPEVLLSVVATTAAAAEGATITTYIDSADILSADNAGAAMDTIDQAMHDVDGYRSELGASANQLEHTVGNLMTRTQYTAAANSRILDADYAEESAALAKAQVLQQAGTAMLAQANASTESVLQLLK